MQFNHKLKCLHWNAQGLACYSKRIQLLKFAKDFDADVILLNETFFNEHHKFLISGYNIYRDDRVRHGGGIAIAIKSSIKHKKLAKIRTREIENLRIEISIQHKNITLISAYNPPSSIQHFRHDLDKLVNISGEYFIFGDFNAKHPSWNCISSNTNGNTLYSMQLNSNFFIHHTPNPTRFSQSASSSISPSTIDLLISNSSMDIEDLRTHQNIMMSDHTPVTCSIACIIPIRNMTYFDFKNTNWRSYRNVILSELPSFTEHSNNMDTTSVENLLVKFIDLINRSTRVVPMKSRKEYQPILSDVTKICIRNRNAYLRRFQRSTNAIERTTLSSIVKQLNILIKANVHIDRNKQWDQFLQNLPSGSSRFWKLSKAMKGKKVSNIPNLNNEGSIAETDIVKANVLADIFVRNNSTTRNWNSPVDTHVNSFMEQFLLNSFRVASSEYTNLEEVKSIICQIKNKKSPGMDNVYGILIKNLPLAAVEFLVEIFNKCLYLGYFPKCLKRAKIIPILKPGKDKHIAESYRPISLLSIISKIFEKVILHRIADFIADRSIIPSFQFGFRAGHSTVHQVKTITDYIHHNKLNRLSTGAAFIDIEKAFDSIWHDGLIFKMNKLDFPVYIQKIIHSFLQNRSFVVKVGNEYSESSSTSAGLPQGSVLSPTLYSIFTSDIQIPSNCKIALYADDTAILVHGKLSNAISKKLQNGLKTVDKYFRKWKVKINITKTQAIIFPYNKSPKRIASVNVFANNNEVPYADMVKYLGVHLDKKLLFRDHINLSISKAHRILGALYPLLNYKSKLNSKNKKMIYFSVIRPILLYANPIWKSASKCHLKKLQILQNKCLKIICNLPRRFSTHRLHEEYNFQYIANTIDQQSSSFLEKCRRSEYPHIRRLGSNNLA